ncbi:MAG TPA: pyridoxal phosphate-dependent aminotransferase [Actinobacteria bacterium]|nr:pyridoxal phosphate-dependent aminotransferase [Actinomycetota bacterium]
MDGRIFLSAPEVTGDELRYVAAAIEENWIGPLGPHVEAFEREVAEATGVSRAVAVSSGTAAIHLALEVLGVGAGDTVVASTFTFIGSVAPLRLVGARPWFVDSESRSWNMDPELLAAAIEEATRRGRRPRAAIVVDIVGQCADWDPIVEICGEAEIPIIEDAAEALGATYRGRPAGSFGTVGIVSFNGNKILTTSTGGALLSDDDGLLDEAFYLATQARDPAPHYEHSRTGFNYRMSSLLAAFGRAQLADLPRRVERRRAIFERYRRELGDLPGISFMPEADFGRANRWLTAILVDREAFGMGPLELMAHLAARDIEARPLWKPMHLQPVFRDEPVTGGRVAEDLFARGLALPSGSGLTTDEQTRVIAAVREAWRR